MGRGRSLRSRAQQCGVPDPEPRLRAELARVPLSTGGGPPPARASRLPQRSGRNLLLWRRAALVALRNLRRVCDPSAGALPDTGAASGCWGRGRAGVRSPRRRFSARSSRRGHSTSPSSRGPANRLDPGLPSSAAAGYRTSPATASGSSPPTSTRPTGSSTTVAAPVSSTRPTGGSRATSRRSRSTSSSPRPRTTPLSAASGSSPGTRSGMRRTGGSRDRTSRGGRRLAPRRLRSGRHFGADAEARRHDRVRSARAGVPQPARRRVSGGSPLFAVEEVLLPAVRRRRALQVQAAARQRRRRLAPGAVHADLPHPSGGTLERRRPRDRCRLRLHPRRRSRAGALPATRRTASAPARAPGGGNRREDGARHAARAVLGLADALPERPSPTRAPGPGPVEDLGRPHRRSEDGRSDRERALPRREFRARQGADPRSEPPLLGPAPRMGRSPRRPLRRRRSGRVAPEGRPRHRLRCLSTAGRTASQEPRFQSRLASGRGLRPPRLQARVGWSPALRIPWFVEHLPMASTGPPSRAQRAVPSDRSRASCTSSRARTSARTGRATARGRHLLVRYSPRPDAGAAPTASTPALAGSCRCAS